jgi:transcriptional regulator with AAA-type ATPase domain
MTKYTSENGEITERISLSDASKKAPKILARGDSLLLGEGAAPTLNDLAGALQFALGDGRIWLSDERIVLMQARVFGKLRASMIQEMGMDRTREQCMKVGWDEGVKLAELVQKRFSQDDLTAALAAGPRLHTMEGYAKVVAKRFEFDAARKQYLGEFYWFDSAEGTEHVRNFGICDCPVCWMQTAVPSGYSSTLLGFPVIFREVECVAQGAERCVVIGKDADSWGGDVPEIELFGFSKPTEKRARPWTPPSTVSVAPKKPDTPTDEIIGTSPAIQRARRLLDKVVAFSEPVMLLGEAGTGKEHFATYLHKRGAAPNGPFVSVNCSMFEESGAQNAAAFFDSDGYLDQAKGGTLFLNDFVSLPKSIQSKLAMILRNKEQDRSFRVIAASGMSPVDAVAQGRLRSDLQYYLSVLPIQVPPLRDRRDDLPDLIQHFLDRHLKRHVKPVEGLSGQVFDMLLRYDYPGNLRELSNLIERGIIYAEPGGLIEANHVFSMVENAPKMARRIGEDGGVYRPKSLADVHRERTLEEVETETIRSALLEHDWNISAAARALGLTRAKLDYRVKKLKLR